MIHKQVPLPTKNCFGVSTCRDIFCSLTDEHLDLQKLAALEDVSKEVKKFINGLELLDGHTYRLLTALGAADYWGQNYNGDIFYEEALLLPGPVYGHKSFLTAGVYRHHQNKDPNKSLGKVVFSHYNPVMHRVELVIDYDHALLEKHNALDLLLIDTPEYSMGAKVKFDRCTVCCDVEKFQEALKGARGDSPAALEMAVLDYLRDVGPIRGIRTSHSELCEHLRNMKNHIIESGPKKGIQVGMINDFPRFHDISQVTRGAAPEAKDMLRLNELLAKKGFKKTAQWHVNSGVSDGLEKVASMDSKLAELQKRFRARGVSVAEDFEDDLPKHLMTSGSLAEIISALTRRGIVLKPHEFQYIVLSKMGDPRCVIYLRKRIVFAPASSSDHAFMEKASAFFKESSAMDIPWSVVANRTMVEPLALEKLATAFVEKSAQMNSTESTYFSKLKAVRNPTLNKVAAAYLGYRKALLDYIHKIAEWTYAEISKYAEYRPDSNSSLRFLGDFSEAYLRSAYLRQPEFAAVNSEIGEP